MMHAGRQVRLLQVLGVALPSLLISNAHAAAAVAPIVINTWSGPFTAATEAAFSALVQGGSAIDAVEAGCSTCERAQCDGTVGHGGSPDESCETTLDAMIMDGVDMDVGAVAGLRRVRHAIAVARLVLERTAHSMLAGDLATRFAVENGFVEEDLGTDSSVEQCRRWREEHSCQPNFRRDVRPDPGSSCGPYNRSSVPVVDFAAPLSPSEQGPPISSHDTISLLALHASGALAAGTSTNGAAHKVPGRVGDGPIAGSGAYADAEVGACGATGDGDVLMRFLPCYQAVENLRRGMGPTEAAEDALRRVLRRRSDTHAGIVVLDRFGRHGSAGSNWNFTYSFRAAGMEAAAVVVVPPLLVVTRGSRLVVQP